LRRWIEQSLVLLRTDSSRGELDVKFWPRKLSGHLSSIARRSGRFTSHHCFFCSNAIRNNVAIIRAPATNVPRTVPETFDCPPVRQR
jgi:hypothetical protein